MPAGHHSDIIRGSTLTPRAPAFNAGKYSAPLKCTTTAAAPTAPSGLRREGGLASTEIAVSWLPPAAAAAALSAGRHVVGHRPLGDAGQYTWVEPTAAAGSGGGGGERLAAKLFGLAPGRTFELAAAVVAARGGAVLARGPAIPLRTAAAGVRYTEMVRVSEFTNDIDFLENHDSATPAALAVLLARMAKQVNVSAACLSELAGLCPRERGQGGNCTACVGALKALPTACGDADMASYNTHFFCGEGWPSFSMFSTPMARYCVADTPVSRFRQPPRPRCRCKKRVRRQLTRCRLQAPLPAAPTHDAGWAEYLSCDAPEAGESNHPTTPRCICWVSWDRAAVSHQPLSVYKKFCAKPVSPRLHAVRTVLVQSPTDVHSSLVTAPTVGRAVQAGQAHGSPVCSCEDSMGPGSIFIRPGSPSSHYVGKSAVMLP